MVCNPPGRQQFPAVASDLFLFLQPCGQLKDHAEVDGIRLCDLGQRLACGALKRLKRDRPDLAAKVGAGAPSDQRQKSLNRVVLSAVYLVVCVIETWPSQSWIALVSIPSFASL
jgi:hypothetical protein